MAMNGNGYIKLIHHYGFLTVRWCLESIRSENGSKFSQNCCKLAQKLKKYPKIQWVKYQSKLSQSDPKSLKASHIPRYSQRLWMVIDKWTDIPNKKQVRDKQVWACLTNFNQDTVEMQML